MKIAPLLEIKKGITAIIGGGGKTTLVHTLAGELSESASVIITTTTHIKKSLVYENYSGNDKKTLEKTLTENRVICVGNKDKDRFTTPLVSLEELLKLADYVLVEADGSRQLPIKAHDVYEPVIPELSNQTIYVIGVDGFGKPIEECVHRPQIYTLKTGTKQGDILTTKTEAIMREKEGLGDRFFINKVESNKDFELSKELASYLKSLNKPVVAGSLKKENYQCL